MAVPIITALKMWAGTLFTKDDWDFNFSQIVSWLADGTSDLVVNTLKTTNGLDMDGAQISNLGAATTGSQAVTLDQANTLLNRISYYYPFSVASGKVDSNGDAAYLQKDSNTQVTVLAGNTNPDLVCIMTDGTIESVTSNTVLTVPGTDGTYHIIKEKEAAIDITSGSSNVITVGKKFPSVNNIGDYFCDNSVVPFKGYKYTSNGWEATEFCWLGDVTVSSGSATVKTFQYNDNEFDLNVYNAGSWTVSESSVLFNSTAIGSYSFSLDSYLPKDDKPYEVLFTLECSSTSSAPGYLKWKTVLESTTSNFDIMAIKRAQGETAYSANTFNVPVKTRTISLEISGSAFSSMSLRAIAYRKCR